ncbi:unnamed protein product [Cylicocyclus nassatus]|uniref:Uncharacterized protein n=1 Tax=Cylicocyclus nassatus TaxID=53992 RepID=A0AA36H692_CYLNA|nr:unnamed protein product [Cylicocyclus nassatus]
MTAKSLLVLFFIFAVQAAFTFAGRWKIVNEENDVMMANPLGSPSARGSAMIRKPKTKYRVIKHRPVYAAAAPRSRSLKRTSHIIDNKDLVEGMA